MRGLLRDIGSIIGSNKELTTTYTIEDLKVGSRNLNEIIGRFGETMVNDSGDKRLLMCTSSTT